MHHVHSQLEALVSDRQAELRRTRHPAPRVTVFRRVTRPNVTVPRNH